MSTPSDIDVLILAGGRGERSRSYLGDTPKFLAPIKNDDILGSLLLEYLYGQRIRRVILALSSGEGGADQILKAFNTPIPNWASCAGDFVSDINIDILTSIEPEPLGITSAIVAARPQLLSDPVMIINGDTLLDLDLTTALSRFCASGSSIMKVVSQTGAHTGCTIVTRGVLTGVGAVGYDDVLRAGPTSHIRHFTTSHRWVDIGTREGYEAACAGNWRR